MANQNPKPRTSYKIGRAAGSGIRNTAAGGATVVSATTAKATSGTDEGVIVMCALIVFLLGFVNSYVVKRAPKSRLRLAIGTGLTFIVLSVVAEFNSKIAKSLAVLILITAILSEGGGVLNFVLGRANNDSLNPNKSTGTPNIPSMGIFGAAPVAAPDIAYGTSLANPATFAGGTGTSVGGVSKNKPVTRGLGTTFPATTVINVK